MNKKAIGIGALLALGALAFAGAAKADEGGDDDDDGLDPNAPVFPNFDPPDPTDPILPNFDPDEPPPPPPPPGVCDFSGCPAFDATHQSATFYRQRLQILGYAIIPNGNPLTAGTRETWRFFQRHYNRVRAGNGLQGPAALRAAEGAPLAYAEIRTSSKLAEDGLPGDRTLRAMERAHRLVNTIGLSWEQCVALS